MTQAAAGSNGARKSHLKSWWNRQARLYDMFTAPMERMLGLAAARPRLFEGLTAGHVLEIGEARYSRALGGDRVSRIDVLCPAADPEVTIVADLTNAPQIADDTFDCIVLPQTLQFIYDHHAVVRTLHRILRPGGTVLASLPLILVISGTDMERWGEYWRYTSKAALHLFADVFGEENVEVRAHGNVLVATAFIQGFAVEDLDPEDFAFNDPLIELVSTVKAVKPAGQPAPRPS